MRNIVLRSLRDHILNHGQLKFLILLIYCGLITLCSSLRADLLLVLFCRQTTRRLLMRINTVIENLHEVFHAFVHARSGSRSLFGGGASVGQSCVGPGRCWKGVRGRGCGFRGYVKVICFLHLAAPIAPIQQFIPIKILILYKRCRVILAAIDSSAHRWHTMPTARRPLLQAPSTRGNLQQIALSKGHLSLIKHGLEGLFQEGLR